MAVTRTERKGRVNKRRAKTRQQVIKRNNRQPVIKNVDVEAIKKQFEENANAEA